MTFWDGIDEGLFGVQHNLLDMPWSDWKIDPSELTIVARPDGSEWMLGSGASGKVSPSPFGVHSR